MSVFNCLRGRLAPAIRAAAALALAAGLGLAAPATAATVNCPGTAATSDREFSLTTATASTCFAWGPGNVSGNPGGSDPDPLFALLATAFGPGHVLIDKSDDGTSGIANGSLSGGLTAGTSGSFAFTLPPAPGGGTWTNLVLAFKSGNGQLDPDWAAFLLPDGVTSGTWTIGDRQALSHVNLYGQFSPVPLPAAAWFLLAGLGGLGAVARRRKAVA